jgi:hypothetical protein
MFPLPLISNTASTTFGVEARFTGWVLADIQCGKGQRHRFYIHSLPHPEILIPPTSFKIHCHMHLPLFKERKMSCIGLNSAHISKRRFSNLNMELLGGDGG